MTDRTEPPYCLEPSTVTSGGRIIRTVSGRKPVAEIWLNGDDPDKTGDFIVAACNAHDALADFARAIIAFTFDGSDVDGDTVQSLALTHGLLAQAVYDPAVHGRPIDAEPGEDVLLFAGPLALEHEGAGQ